MNRASFMWGVRRVGAGAVVAAALMMGACAGGLTPREQELVGVWEPDLASVAKLPHAAKKADQKKIDVAMIEMMTQMHVHFAPDHAFTYITPGPTFTGTWMLAGDKIHIDWNGNSDGYPDSDNFLDFKGGRLSAPFDSPSMSFSRLSADASFAMPRQVPLNELTDKSVVGQWKIESDAGFKKKMSAHDETDLQSMAKIVVVMSFVLSADHTISANGLTGTWKTDGDRLTLTTDLTNDINFTLHDGKLVGDNDLKDITIAKFETN